MKLRFLFSVSILGAFVLSCSGPERYKSRDPGDPILYSFESTKKERSQQLASSIFGPLLAKANN